MVMMFLFQVERIVDKRKTRKGKVEYLVRWRGYGSEGDTWEPESHLSTCMIYVHDFNRQYAERQRDSILMRSTRSSPNHHASVNNRQLATMTLTATARTDISGAVSRNVTVDSDKGKPALGVAPPSSAEPAEPASVSQQQPASSLSGSLLLASPGGSARRTMDLSKTGIKILVPKSPMNSRLDSEESPSEAGVQEAHLVPPEVALLEKPAGVQLGPGEERARMGTRSRNQNPLSPPQAPVTPAAMRSLSRTGES